MAPEAFSSKWTREQLRDAEAEHAIQIYERQISKRRPPLPIPTRADLDEFQGSIFQWTVKHHMEDGELLARLARSSNYAVMPVSTSHPTPAAESALERIRWNFQCPAKLSPFPWLPIDVLGSFIVMGHYNPFATDFGGIPEALVVKVLVPWSDYHRIRHDALGMLLEEPSAGRSVDRVPAWVTCPEGRAPKTRLEWMNLLLKSSLIEGAELYASLSEEQALEKFSKDEATWRLIEKKMRGDRLIPTSSLMPTVEAFELLPRRMSLDMPVLCYFASGSTRYVLMVNGDDEGNLQDQLNQGPSADSPVSLVALETEEGEIRRLLNLLSGRDVVTVTSDGPQNEKEALYGRGGVRLDPAELSRLTGSELETLLGKGEETPVVDGVKGPAEQALEWVLHRAVVYGASDIHIFPAEAACMVATRVHGKMRETAKFPFFMLPKFSSLLKTKCQPNLDVAESRRPQDGAFRMWVGKMKVECRVSIIAESREAESAVIRLAPDSSMTLQKMNLPDRHMAFFDEIVYAPSGIFLVTGGTGSGKTSTLNAFLSYAKGLLPDESFVTVEDPVERYIPGFKQFQVNEKTRLGFTDILRAMLRHDPDNALIGEIRDRETAELAFQFSNTGHLVFSTLHTNNAPGAIRRLLGFGLPPEQIASSIILLQSQDLVRTLCTCAERREMTAAERQIFTGANYDADLVPDYLMQKKGCVLCNKTGFAGRQVVMEFCPVTPELQELITDGRPYSQLVECARSYGYRTIYEEGLELVMKGVTTLDELRSKKRPFGDLKKITPKCSKDERGQETVAKNI